ncbi:MAG: hypothetical protein WC455_17730 [Dehalococcoidia bacterium]
MTETAIIKHEEKPLAIVPSAQNLRMLSQDLLNSGMFPAVKNVAGAITIIEYGRELGIPPVAALQTMSIVNGKLCMESKAILALFQNHGGKIKIIERSKVRAKIEFSKNGNEPYVHEYTMEQAKTEQLAGKAMWTKIPETMLFWRAIATGIRAYDPGTMFGLYSKEEVVDFTEKPDAPATTPATPTGEAEKIALGASGGPKMGIVEGDGEVFDASVEPSGPETDLFGDEIVSDEGPSETPGPPTIDEPPLEKLHANGADGPVMDGLINAIKEALKAEGVDEKLFRAWLFKYQTAATPPRRYVGKQGQSIRFHMGSLDDLKFLFNKIGDSIKKYKKQVGG